MEEQQKKPTVYLIDGSNYVYRAFYAIRELTNSKGFPTNAIYGFTNMLMRLIRECRPSHLAVVFDSPGPTFRRLAYAEYKATRKAMPDDLAVQIPAIKDVIRGFSIPVIEREGLEADDIIGALAVRFSRENLRTKVVSGDKDMMQLVSADVTMIDTMKDKTYDVEAVRERFGVPPEKVVEVLGLAGDSSDNIPGIPGIGEKTAFKLIAEYGSIEGLLENLDRVKNNRLRDNLRQNADQARMSRELATIRTDAEIPLTLEDFLFRGPDERVLKELFTEYEFSTLVQKMKVEVERSEGVYRIAANDNDISDVLMEARSAGRIAIEPIFSSAEPMRAVFLGMALAAKPEEAFYVPAVSAGGTGGSGAPAGGIPEALRAILSDGSIKKFGHDLKNAAVFLLREGIEPGGFHFDVMVASYLLNPSKRGYRLDETVREYLRKELPQLKDMEGGAKESSPAEASPETLGEYACRRADYILRTGALLEGEIERGGFGELLYSMEMPLLLVLAAMERNGVLVDRNMLELMSGELDGIMHLSEEKIHSLSGESFNINSPKQLQRILFEKMKLPAGKRTKEGFSTDVEVLTNLALSYELPAEILAYRSFAKLKSTYVDALPQLINPSTGRIHTSYNQTATATGRLSSSNPNLQNIPIRTLEGKRIRQAFTAPDGHEIVSADYSQIELRILAHLSGDEALIEAFRTGEDIHRRTASDVFGVFPGMVNPEMRRQAKVINFGILYGMSPFGLSRELGISQKLAKTYIDEYFHKYEGVKKFIDNLLQQARKDGYVTTLMKRRRYLPDIGSRNPAVRQFAERAAVNAPIQGTAADIIKIAMLNIAGAFGRAGIRSRMIMQVHDELVFEVSEKERDDVLEVVRREMEGVVELSVPLLVEAHSGKNWDEAH
ncbi:MAG: DNA polymerase I [Deltaproteobacteria bacterium]|nr:DNA polymerase I [Deltaproteobacteria bacterium]